ncbi:BMC domain-containing protein [Telmatospirillum sp.]|uniref:BMC domain-containing protein n=1 Tax=Telmatospirillum sp. TaxID=2079197 RepID=UPI00284F8EE3|nr:BMC domain-containing protein [Telmatospirillum sp.]MDR3438601.1 BMC domain-containing protein [Telmatospirillum sp.]
MPKRYAAVGMVEFSSIAAGIDGADQMVKAAQVEPVFFKTICPGKFVAAVSGEVAAVTASIGAGRAQHPETVVDWFVISNIHEDVVRALTGTSGPAGRKALGIIETFSAVSIVVAADAAVKAANVQLMDVRIALGLGGKGYALMTGDVAACQAAVAAGSAEAAEHGLLVSRIVIPSPADSVFSQIA